MKIISVDPGFDRVGIAVLEKGTKKSAVVFSECFTPKKSKNISDRIFEVGKEIAKVIKKYSPSAMAIEKLYITNNQKTAMAVGEARGVIIYEAMRAGISLYEYTPGEIKVAVTGYGKADKGMVMSMVPKLVELAQESASDDELDAIAIGLTCLAREKGL
jgi:crossover junction endodeoxyribonuclease RuvC